MSDMPRHSAPEHDNNALRHTLSLSEVEAELSMAGVPRSHRHIQRLCKNGAFDAQLLPGPSGDEWKIAPHSVAKVIGDLRAIDEQRQRRAATRRAVSHDDALQDSSQSNTGAARHGALERAASEQKSREGGSATDPTTSRYVALLERDNEFLREQVKNKDEQITDLSKRFGETQTLLGAMQRMLAPLLGQADPFKVPDKRDVEPADLSPDNS
jgi:hypothetical protein